ncbi:uncharacterized protein BO97DRAFT_33899 [Aspergillus homomorphus CBS 101889]|uniref:Uncharacterized protein n=1 Tax=Aspergillus homomorphus (strain CBS 101889) TaxID=1450537 RepID=A0A395I122_ASPHC|nr:hypothetical protein BO97DRAFT_33899 [Aspergillus homomorphus CBS 101889]RAL13627.1 hypothetical protein BO97DRAFT_33899 [Aspergillus homomorphus CBS 101889]
MATRKRFPRTGHIVILIVLFISSDLKWLSSAKPFLELVVYSCCLPATIKFSLGETSRVKCKQGIMYIDTKCLTSWLLSRTGPICKYCVAVAILYVGINFSCQQAYRSLPGSETTTIITCPSANRPCRVSDHNWPV